MDTHVKDSHTLKGRLRLYSRQQMTLSLGRPSLRGRELLAMDYKWLTRERSGNEEDLVDKHNGRRTE